MTQDRTFITGRLDYMYDTPEQRGTKLGFEDFSITRFADGRLTQRAFCRIARPGLDVERDSVMAVDANWRPTNAFVRIETSGQFTGSAWYTFSKTDAECAADTRGEGRVTYRRALDGPFSFCCHALVGDAWMIAAGDPGKDGARVPWNLLTSTINKSGASGPALAYIPYGIERVGRETITVAAGTFETIQYRCGRIDGVADIADAPFSYHMWVSDDPYRVCVRSAYPGASKYELVEMTVNEGLSA
ncbi:MAG: hypothetical protein O3C65_11650 [Proteobacteria bacterium]|nr:hypothetical protein [Pseudomonadota bacterium]